MVENGSLSIAHGMAWGRQIKGIGLNICGAPAKYINEQDYLILWRYNKQSIRYKLSLLADTPAASASGTMYHVVKYKK